MAESGASSEPVTPGTDRPMSTGSGTAWDTAPSVESSTSPAGVPASRPPSPDPSGRWIRLLRCPRGGSATSRRCRRRGACCGCRPGGRGRRPIVGRGRGHRRPAPPEPPRRLGVSRGRGPAVGEAAEMALVTAPAMSAVRGLAESRWPRPPGPAAAPGGATVGTAAPEKASTIIVSPASALWTSGLSARGPSGRCRAPDPSTGWPRGRS